MVAMDIRQTGLLVKQIFFLIIVSFSISCVTERDNSCIYDPVNTNIRNFTHLRNGMISGINISKGMFRGMLAYTPPGYDKFDTSKKHPVIIYFHGKQAKGVGSKIDLCKILWDGTTGYGPSLPSLIEYGKFPDAIEKNGQTYSFIVISPQFVDYRYPAFFPSINDVDSVINCVLKNFQADPSRIYLTGMSTGANMIIEYAGSTMSRGKIAAISIASLCDVVGTKTNYANNINPENIAASGLPIWFMQCIDDGDCSIDITKEWVERINKAHGTPPRFTILDDSNPDPAYHCAGFKHNTWFKLYDPDFRVDGSNLYEWFLQFSSKPE
jgi:hypothetical protein